MYFQCYLIYKYFNFFSINLPSLEKIEIIIQNKLLHMVLTGFYYKSTIYFLTGEIYSRHKFKC